jgi:hypothetical protein
MEKTDSVIYIPNVDHKTNAKKRTPSIMKVKPRWQVHLWVVIRMTSTQLKIKERISYHRDKLLSWRPVEKEKYHTRINDKVGVDMPPKSDSCRRPKFGGRTAIQIARAIPARSTGM